MAKSFVGILIFNTMVTVLIGQKCTFDILGIYDHNVDSIRQLYSGCDTIIPQGIALTFTISINAIYL
jgi:hypothetical protein